MRRIAIIHFNPIELYPPVMNWLNYVGSNQDQLEIRVFTKKNYATGKSFYPNNKSIKIIRIGGASKRNSLLKYFDYFLFHAYTTLQLSMWRPGMVMYYETISSLPAIMYKRFLNKRSRLFIHYHEYSSPAEYGQAGIFTRLSHSWEKKIYPSAEWLSHTNKERMNFFLEDNKRVSIPNPFILPNYPPGSWFTNETKKNFSLPLKIVYVGALSLETMYTKEFVNWIIKQNGKITFDIYSSNITTDAKDFLLTADKNIVRLYCAADYFSLPGIFRNYDVGIILYKGHIPNYIYNAPNKLFEYHVNGLDVWFPEQMLGASAYVKTDSYPKILALNFEKLSDFKTADLTNRDGLPFIINKYSSEIVFKELQSVLFA
jgi:hypothetical protein